MVAPSKPFFFTSASRVFAFFSWPNESTRTKYGFPVAAGGLAAGEGEADGVGVGEGLVEAGWAGGAGVADGVADGVAAGEAAGVGVPFSCSVR